MDHARYQGHPGKVMKFSTTTTYMDVAIDIDDIDIADTGTDYRL